MYSECFIICPIGEEGSDTRNKADLLYDCVVVPACEKFDITPVRVDKLDTNGVITDSIIRYLRDSKYVIADLSGHNPNVFYELGIRHALNKDVILIMDKEDKRPFDIHGMSMIDYSSLEDSKEANRLTTAIQNRFKNSLNGVALSSLPYNNLLGEETKVKSIFFEKTDCVFDEIKELREYIQNNFSSDIEDRTRINARYIDGEENAFEALTKATLSAKNEVRSTRFFPASVLGNQKYVSAIESRVLGTDGRSPLKKYFRIVALNNIEKFKDILHDINTFQGKEFELHLTKTQNAFELVVIDSSDAFIHFYKDQKVIASTLHIRESTIVREFKVIYDKILESTELDYVFDCSKISIESSYSSITRAKEIFSQVFSEFSDFE